MPDNNFNAYLEFCDGTSAKFWEIGVKANEVCIRFGKIGTKGQTQTKAYSSKEEALEQAKKQVAAKTDKGYIIKSHTINSGANFDSLVKPNSKVVEGDALKKRGRTNESDELPSLGDTPANQEIAELKEWVALCLSRAEISDSTYPGNDFRTLQSELNSVNYGAHIKWKNVRIERVDRLGTFLFGPNYCSNKHPWPNGGRKPMLPIFQLNFDGCREHFELPDCFPSGLLQVFMPQGKYMPRDALIRLIDGSDLKSSDIGQYPMLDVGTTNTGDFEWSCDDCRIKQCIGFGERRTFADLHFSIVELVREREISAATKELGVNPARIVEIGRAVEKEWSKHRSCIMGSFQGIQYCARDLVVKPLICIDEDDWESGNAQIFYQDTANGVKFSFDWSR